MPRGWSRAATALALPLLALAACKGPVVPSPLTGESRYLCCNMHYEKPEVTDVNYQRGALIPFGTRVQILEVRKASVKFQPEGHPPMTLVMRHGRNIVTMDQYMDRIFVTEDPRLKLRGKAAPPARGKKGSKAARTPDTSAAIVNAIEQSTVEVGMTRDQVLMSLGYPPPHRTPSLESPTWTYWMNRWDTFTVNFDGNKVASVVR
jgi:hypothetical protein